MNACAASNGGTSEPSTRTWTGGSVAATGSAGASSSSTRTVLRAPLTIPFRLLLPCDSERRSKGRVSARLGLFASVRLPVSTPLLRRRSERRLRPGRFGSNGQQPSLTQQRARPLGQADKFNSGAVAGPLGGCHYHDR